MEPEKLSKFRKLVEDGVIDKSPATPDRDYNCIAFALDIEDAVWWPGRDDCFWPDDDDDQGIENFERVFSIRGFETCIHGIFEPGFEKVAFYVARGEVTHAAKQLTDGRWKSKIGVDWEDIEHNTVHGVESNLYGAAKHFMKRKIPS